MSCPEDPHRPFFHFGNPFKMMLPKGSCLSPKLLELLNKFEEALAERFHKLSPKYREDVLTLSWAVSAMELLCQTHTDIKTLITALESIVCDWDDKWVNLYLENSVKLLDICIAFSSEFSRLNRGNLLLRCALRYLEDSSSTQYTKACSSLVSWKQHMSSKNPRLYNSFCILDSLTKSLNLLKIKNSAKGKVLMRAMYGVKVFTLFVCRIIAAAFSGSVNQLVNIQVPGTCLWAKAFSDVQSYVNGEIRILSLNGSVTVLKELEAVDISVKKIYPMLQNGEKAFGDEVFVNSKSDLRDKVVKLSKGLDLLAKRVDGFFQIVLSGRDALLCNLTMGSNLTDLFKDKDVEGLVAS